MTFQELIEKHHINQSELSRRSGVPQASISSFATGRSRVRNMKISVAVKLSHGLGISFGEFINELNEVDDGVDGVDILKSDSERELVGTYRAMNVGAKDCLSRVAHSMTYDENNLDSSDTGTGDTGAGD